MKICSMEIRIVKVNLRGEGDLHIIGEELLPEYDTYQIEGDRDFPSDLALNWSRNAAEPLVPPFIPESQMTVNLDREASPLEYFQLYMDNTDMDNISFETNRYFAQIRANRQPSAHARLNAWVDTTGPEIRKFLGMTILMGLVQKPVLSSYWSTDSLENTPAFAKQMTRDRFMSILSFLHLADNWTAPARNEEGYDPLYKVKPIYDIITARFRNTYIPDRDIVIDEGMVPWRGRLRFRQCIPSKPDKFGMKLYILSESKSGYICDFDIYTGADYNPDPNAKEGEETLGHSYGVVMGLLKKSDLLNKGYCLYVDNYYTSPVLFDTLSAEDTSAVGTLRINRLEVPVALKSKTNNGDVIFRQRGNLLALKWTDKRDVSILSTLHTATMTVTNKLNVNGEPIVKPTCILDYNKKMGGEDRSDQLAKYYTFTRKTNKWWLKLFFHIVNLVVTNAYILHKKNGARQLSQYKFRRELSRQLMDGHVMPRQPQGRPSARQNEES